MADMNEVREKIDVELNRPFESQGKEKLAKYNEDLFFREQAASEAAILEQEAQMMKGGG